MECTLPTELSVEELQRYVDNEADEKILNHLEQCSYCREKAGQLARFQTQLIAPIYRFECPSPLDLGRYQLQLLPSEYANVIESHLEECILCNREIAELKISQRDIPPMKEMNILDEVRILIGRLVSRDSEKGIMKDPAFAPVPAGIRGKGDGPYIYQVDHGQVVIAVKDDVENEGQKVLFGLIAGFDHEALTVRLWREVHFITSVEVDEAGSFIIKGLTAGDYELILTGNEVEVHIQDLHI
jgi:hypothetical protein